MSRADQQFLFKPFSALCIFNKTHLFLILYNDTTCDQHFNNILTSVLNEGQ